MKELLTLMNPWWRTGEVPPELLGIEREEYLYTLLNESKKKFVSIVTGPRRTGKTTVMYQLVQKLLEKKQKPKQILYAQMDHPGIPVEDGINRTVREFREINKIPRSSKVYLLLDEVQYIKEWPRWIKALHDLENVKIYISGSTTAVIEHDAYASLAGRYQKTWMWPLGFNEFMNFKNIEIQDAEPYLYNVYLKDYFITGGFPEAVLETNENTRSRYLTGYFDDMIFKDISRTHAVRDYNLLREIAIFLAKNIGSPTSINKLKNTFRSSIETVREYLGYLSDTYLFTPVLFYSSSLNERIYNSKKYYIVDTGMRFALDPVEQTGPPAENVLFNYLKSGKELFYWKRSRELDFYIPSKKQAIECKYKDEISGKDIKGLLSFLDSYKLKKGFVVTEDLEDERTMSGKKIVFLPLWKILMGRSNEF